LLIETTDRLLTHQGTNNALDFWQQIFLFPFWLKRVTLVFYHTISNTRGADQFLARPTSRCRRTEWIVALGWGVCSCAELQVFFFFCYRVWKEKFQTMSSISTTSRAVIEFFFPARQGAEVNLRHSDKH
jgi:hypothetical protein